jgi:phenylalanyl-tRNA synthetase alpha chain
VHVLRQDQDAGPGTALPDHLRRPKAVCRDGRWVEVWECGLAHPEVLAAAGLGGRGGLALGMGLDRLLMLVKRIPDIRLLRSGDPRIARQMLDLARYRPVSSMPAITRDLSVAVSDDDDEETLGDRVRNALGAKAGCVEEVRVLSTTTYQQLPASAIGRLGARPGQKNLLVRAVLRDLDKTLTSEAANALRDRIYRALHQGTDHRIWRPWCRALSPPQVIRLRDRCSAWRRAHSRLIAR